MKISEKKYLSICIPTNGRTEILLNTLDSIYLIDKHYLVYFEVVITDNSSNNEDLEKHLTKYNKFGNLKYFSSTAPGFLNIFQALENGSAVFLKLHNNYTKFSDSNSLISLIEIVKRYCEEKPLIYFTNGQLGKMNDKSYENFDKFSYDLSFWNTWAMGFSIWKEDFDKYKFSDLNIMFPHTSLLLCHSKSHKNYLIVNKLYFINQEVPNKGGYDLFKTFAVDYLSMIKYESNKRNISNKTFLKIKHDLFYKFLIQWHYNLNNKNNKYTFELNNVRDNILVYYSTIDYYWLVMLSFFIPFYQKLKKLFY